jgi:hypothetical protein
MAKQQVKSNGFSINMLLEKETPGALRYAEVNSEGQKVDANSGAKIGTLYIRKSALEVAPKAITVQLTVRA